MGKELIAVKLINREIKRLEKRLEKLSEDVFDALLDSKEKHWNNFVEYGGSLGMYDEKTIQEKKLYEEVAEKIQKHLDSFDKRWKQEEQIKSQIEELRQSIMVVTNYYPLQLMYPDLS